MKYLAILLAIALTACQAPDLAMPEQPVTKTTPAPTPEVDLEPEPMPTFCIPRGDVNHIDVEDPDSLDAFFWDYDLTLQESQDLIEMWMYSQGYTIGIDYTLSNQYRRRWSVTGVVIQVDNLDYDGMCHGS